MRKIFKLILIGLLIVLIVIQFFRPEKNNSPVMAENTITAKIPIPDSVQGILKVSCYDCHSNKTIYPWYSNFQPVMWFLTNHIIDGKRHLNFDEFAVYSLARQYKKLKEIGEQVKAGEMPMESYTLIHRDAVLSPSQKELIYSWVSNSRQLMESQYPADSLKSKPRK